MKIRTMLASLTGLGAGYVLGAAAGRERFEQIKAQAQRLVSDPSVRQKVTDLPNQVKDKVQDAQGKVQEAKSGDSSTGSGFGSTGSGLDDTDASFTGTSFTGTGDSGFDAPTSFDTPTTGSGFDTATTTDPVFDTPTTTDPIYDPGTATSRDDRI